MCSWPRFRSSLGASLPPLADDRTAAMATSYFSGVGVSNTRLCAGRCVDGLGMTFDDIDDFIEYLAAVPRLVQIYFRWRPTLPDPDDDRYSGGGSPTGSPIVTSM